MKTWKWISKTLGKRKWMVGLLGVMQSILAASGIAFALLMRYAIDSAVEAKTTDFWQAVLGLVLLILFQIVLRALNRFFEDDTSAAIENRLRQKAFDGILKKEYGKISEYHTGELMNRLTSDTAVITDGVVTLLPSLLSMLVRIIGVLIVMSSIEPWIATVFLFGGCFVAALSILPRKWQKKIHKKTQEADGTVRSFMQESLSSLLVIHAFGCEDKIEKENDERMKSHRAIRRKRSNAYNVFGSGLRFCIQCGYIFGFVWCGVGILNDSITYGTLTAVLQLIGQIQTPFANIGSTLPKYAATFASAERLIELTEESERYHRPNIVNTREEVYAKLKEIRFEQVSFSYDYDREVLRNESFSVKKGEVVALIGSSGVGKSTIMKLLLSVYQPDSGDISVQLENERIGLQDLPSGMFAYVPQGNYLMSGAIWQVVGFAETKSEIDREKVIEACKIACAHEFIEELPQGYDSVLGERGAGLSEGQMQRLAVARAVYSGCPILLLDEATSALDAETERRMIASLKHMSDYTVFLVTHRKDVWELCDRVLERKE